MKPNSDRRLTNLPLRAGLWALTIVGFATGVLATLTPRAFYDHVLWVDLVPPYADHLMRDYGAMNLALGVVTLVAAITMDRLIVRTTLGAYIVFAIPHLIFHVTHHQHYTTAAAVGETTALVVAVLLPLALLALTANTASTPHHR
jgi:hypothetical protein